VVVFAGAAGAYIYTGFDRIVPVVAMGVNYFRYLNAPKGTIEIETAPDSTDQTAAIKPNPVALHAEAEADWPSYNKTLTSQRFSALNQINSGNASDLKVICTFDTGEYASFNSGVIDVRDTLLFATEYNTYAIDPDTCAQKWRAHETYTPATAQGVNRGVAYLDNMIFRGTQDGRVLAYDFSTGKTPGDIQRGPEAPSPRQLH